MNKQTINKSKEKLARIWRNGSIGKCFRISYDVIWNLLLFFIISGIIVSFFLGGIGLGYFASLVKDEEVRSFADMERSIYNYEETTSLYFADQKYLGKLPSDLHREEVKLEEVSDHLKNALIATEDEYFLEHNGVVPKAILRAIFQELTNSNVKTGGSTLTQQLIKNQILTNEVSFERKAKEILLALRLERFFDKDEILEAYLNVAPFGRDSSGRNIAGIQTAAEGIFGVKAKDLNIPQAAFIAGLPQAPFAYTPFLNGGQIKNEEGLQAGLNRMKSVLNRMHKAGFITEKQLEEALEYDIASELSQEKESIVQEYPYLTFEVLDRAKDIMAKHLAGEDGYTIDDFENNKELRNRYMIIAERSLRQKGYRIHTTIDKDIYEKFQEITKNFEHFGPDHSIVKINPETGEKESAIQPLEVGSVLIENSTGKIISFVGGRDFFEFSQNNHATNTKRPNGSTMKPLLDYAPGMELGVVQPGSPIPDVSFTYEDSTPHWSPKNYTGRETGLTTARVALARSYNIPAARTYLQILNQQPANYLLDMGITTLEEQDMYNASLSLGSPRQGLTVEETVNAYVTFGNMGQFIDAYMIDKIETNDGEVIYEHNPEPVEVFSPQTSYLMIDMMRDVLRSGTATYTQSALKYKNVDWAGKTGTTQFFQDTWFVATNPNVTIGSWMGYDNYDANADGRSDKRINVRNCSNCTLGYSSRNLLFWSELVNAASEIKPDLMIPSSDFKRPGGLERTTICAVSGLLPSEECKELGLTTTDWFNAKHVPREEDYSIVKGNYVTIDGKVYDALDETPEEFTENGYFLNIEFIEDKGWDDIDDLSDLFPKGDNWNKIKIPSEETLKNDEKAPSKPKEVKISNDNLTWKASGEKDVIGYRVYVTDQEGELGTLIGVTTETSFKLQTRDKEYYVTAVDFFGQESSPSKRIIYGTIEDPDQPDDLEEEEEEEKQEENEEEPNEQNDDSDQNNNDGSEEQQSDDTPEDDGSDDSEQTNNETIDDDNEIIDPTDNS
ncbi:transglycosylase domain-containing protein [Salirhabdus salicampi]|uniref:transglycosylase domain-containing protein n=1 Tax=Salirhabdus salicampi TaxID=476102 RepID=UPI0020C2923D|nr:transglycosylase domain-containing protein [Salirhabdus salicampi]MCP8617138.1 penicillin-binding protein [Salirhabdus salicampi]